MNKFDLTTSKIVNTRANPVWKKIIDADAIKKWWNGARVATDWKVGSKVEFMFVEQPTPRFDHGKIIELVENERLVLNLWSVDYGNPDEDEPYKVVIYDLKYLGNEQTRLTLSVASYDSEEEMEKRRPLVDTIVNKIKFLAEHE
ncbi:SRPBCC domain-containing protein [Gynurincola endophyticus]|uniref:SRPBCC domain-containing protein n=1 Tax=Gynurincola endophyticus TaxID=2479004 RepID=UPI000F8F4E7C|nr:SRPBCC domain-containing protein [Gynurincola endophyticus]